MKRTFCRVALVALGGFTGILSAATAEKFDFAILETRARNLATRPYVARSGEVPAWLRSLTYDQLRKIEFGGANSLWLREGLPFQVQYLHPGFLFDRMVYLSEVRGGQAFTIPFRREYFNYNEHYLTLKPGDIPETMGFAGLRLMYPLDGPGARPSEVGSFAGASYFRFLSKGATYGLSARGLALNTWEPDGEEFPTFTEFWLERPANRAQSVNVYALLESASVTGAYRFTIAPGEATTVEIKAAIYRRANTKEVKVIGLAPLTSMFWHAENSEVTRDFRPEVHDSDGLLMHNGAGEWIWRPLVNGKGVRYASFFDENPRAFGLLQRDRDFEHYQDLEAGYHTRPSLLVEPLGKWGKGFVRLVEIPTTTEFDDNIVAFWVPEKLPPPGAPIEVEYRLTWGLKKLGPPAGFVRSTRHGKSARYEPGLERFVVDFDGERLQRLNYEDRIEHPLSVGEGATLHHVSLLKNSINGTWRVAFTIKPDGSGRAVELRCFLKSGTEVLTETWSYLWQP